jgi:hypothetical protein
MTLPAGSSNGVNDDVHAMVVFQDHLIVGGRFTADGSGQPLSGVARWDGATWSVLGNETINGVGSGGVDALHVFQGKL